MFKLIALLPKLFFFFEGIIGLGFIIAFHELGHFLFCKAFNIRVPSFSIGFGPKLFSKKIGGTEFSLSAIPLGGYVEIAGSAEVGQGEQKESSANDEGSFARKPFYQKLLVMLGGIAFNILFAYVVLSLLFMSGMPKSTMLYPRNATATIGIVGKNSSAEKAGLQVGDEILEVNGQVMGNAKIILETLRPLAGTSADILIKRGERKRKLSVPVEEKSFLGRTGGALPVMFEIKELAGYGFFESIRQGISLTQSYLKNIFIAFGHILKKRDTSQMASPIAIISATVNGAAQGFKIFLLFLVLISINLAVFNLFPLPILDGGQILFNTIEAIIRRPLPEKIRTVIHYISWISIMGLFIFLSLKDIMNLVGIQLSSLLAFFK